MTCTLYYWPGLQGRGEFVRLALEEAGAPYVVTALEQCPRLARLQEAVFTRPRIASYLVSGRRQAFNDDDLFRRYPELGD